MIPGGGKGGSGQDPSPVGRFVVGALVTLVMSFIMLALYSTVPHYQPRLQTEGPRRAPIQNGIWEKNDFFGLIDTQWTFADGKAEGPALQFHSNGSLFRELEYRDGKLNGPAREYYQKGPYRRSPTRGRMAGAAERAAMAGDLKRIMRFHDGAQDGPYEIYYPGGILKEEGVYRDGKRRSSVRYRKDGSPVHSGNASGQKEDAWALGR